MRTLRLNRTFDAVFVHDAIAYMTSHEDLCAVAQAAFDHTRRGGAALFAPDHVRDTFHESTNLIEGDDGSRALRGLEWTSVLDRVGAVARTGIPCCSCAMDMTSRRSTVGTSRGCFPNASGDGVLALAAAGFEVETITRGIPEGQTDKILLCRRR